MTNRTWLAAGSVLFCAIVAVAIYMFMQQSAADSRAMILPVDPAPLLAETDEGRKSFSVEVADDPGEREKGLMFRQDMADDHGMLFVFETTRPVGFWMRNTPMPLDLLFVSQNGKVEAILPGEPFSDAVITPGEPVRFVLELKRGTAESTGIRSGDILRHPAISQAAGPGNGG